MVYLAIWLFMASLAVTAIAALVWAIRTGQFADFQQGARSIFDADEPVGDMTDHFPKYDRNETSGRKTQDEHA